jgi:hypothetical protein
VWGVSVKIVGILTAVREIMLIIFISVMMIALLNFIRESREIHYLIESEEEVSDINFNSEEDGLVCTQRRQNWLMA